MKKHIPTIVVLIVWTIVLIAWIMASKAILFGEDSKVTVKAPAMIMRGNQVEVYCHVPVDPLNRRLVVGLEFHGEHEEVFESGQKRSSYIARFRQVDCVQDSIKAYCQLKDSSGDTHYASQKVRVTGCQ